MLLNSLPKECFNFEKLVSNAGWNVKGHCTVVAKMIISCTSLVSLGEWAASMWFSNVCIFLKSNGNTKATVTVSFSLLVSLSCDVLVTVA